MKIKYLLCILLSFLIFGCVAEEIVYNVHRNEETLVTYTVKSNSENLADVAKRLTGSASNWQLLASYNPNINSYNLKRGDKIQIPRKLMIDGENLWLEQEVAWDKVEYNTKTISEPQASPTSATPEPTVESTPSIPTPNIEEKDITLSPYEIEDRKNIRNEILSDILND